MNDNNLEAITPKKGAIELPIEIEHAEKDPLLDKSLVNENKEKVENEAELKVEKEKKESNVKKIAEKEMELAGLAAQSTPAAIQKKREEEIDKILSDGLSEIFLKMTPDKQKEFQAKGEETVKKIAVLLQESRVKVNKIVDLIKKWLKLIHGVNRFFLDQAAKLKVDKIIRMKDSL